jgi:hypothetical protein
MKHFGSVGRKWSALIVILCGEHFEYGGQFRERFFTGGHERVASRDGGNLGYPGTLFLPVQHGLVVFQLHLWNKYSEIGRLIPVVYEK